jgi:two-component system chemotaxis response regulator CheY
MKILIVDDSAFMRNMIKNILKEQNHELFEAGNGDEAVTAYQQNQPNLVFMDIIMPGKNGVEVLKDIKAMDQGANVVMCTSVGGQDKIIQECVEAGATDFITKPFTPDEINSIVSRFIQG